MKDAQLALRRRHELSRVRVRYGYRRRHVKLRREGYTHGRSGAKILALTIVDVYSREALAIEIGSRQRAEHVVAALDRLVAAGRKPKYLLVDNGAELSGRLLDLWAYRHQVRIDFSRPGKPTDNGHVESFNGSLSR